MAQSLCNWLRATLHQLNGQLTHTRCLCRISASCCLPAIALVRVRRWAVLGCGSVNFEVMLYCAWEKVRVQFILQQATKAQRGEYRYSSTLSLNSAVDAGWLSTVRPGRFTPGKETRYPLYWRLGGPQGRSGRVRRISPYTEIRSLDRPARSELLYRLSYPGPHCAWAGKLKLVFCKGLRPS